MRHKKDYAPNSADIVMAIYKRGNKTSASSLKVTYAICHIRLKSQKAGKDRKTSSHHLPSHLKKKVTWHANDKAKGKETKRKPQTQRDFTINSAAHNPHPAQPDIHSLPSLSNASFRNLSQWQSVSSRNRSPSSGNQAERPLVHRSSQPSANQEVMHGSAYLPYLAACETPLPGICSVPYLRMTRRWGLWVSVRNANAIAKVMSSLLRLKIKWLIDWLKSTAQPTSLEYIIEDFTKHNDAAHRDETSNLSMKKEGRNLYFLYGSQKVMQNTVQPSINWLCTTPTL